MKGPGRVAVRQLLGQQFPVSTHDLALRRTNDCQPAIGALQSSPQIPAKFAQIGLEILCSLIPVAKDHAAEESCLGGNERQSVSVLAELIFVHIFFERRAKETAILAECPAMIGTFEALRAPLFLPAQRNAAMGAGVEQYSDTRSEERRVGKGCGGTCKSRWAREH